MRPATWAGAGALAGAALAQGGTALSSLPALRKRLWPGLNGNGRPGHVALTFDDGPDPASTMRFVEALDVMGWKATFFMLGSMARLAPGLAAEVAAAGHEVAVHGDVHVSQLARTPRAVVDDVARARDTLAELSGQEPRFNRPPYGVLSGGGLLAARRAGLKVVLWSAWGRDWRQEATARTVVADIRRGVPGPPPPDLTRPDRTSPDRTSPDRTPPDLTPADSGGADLTRPGPTVLLHDSDCTSAPGAWRSALEALPLLAEWLVPLGWEVGPLRSHF